MRPENRKLLERVLKNPSTANQRKPQPASRENEPDLAVEYEVAQEFDHVNEPEPPPQEEEPDLTTEWEVEQEFERLQERRGRNRKGLMG